MSLFELIKKLDALPELSDTPQIILNAPSLIENPSCQLMSDFKAAYALESKTAKIITSILHAGFEQKRAFIFLSFRTINQLLNNPNLPASVKIHSRNYQQVVQLMVESGILTRVAGTKNGFQIIEPNFRAALSSYFSENEDELTEKEQLEEQLADLVDFCEYFKSKKEKQSIKPKLELVTTPTAPAPTANTPVLSTPVAAIEPANIPTAQAPLPSIPVSTSAPIYFSTDELENYKKLTGFIKKQIQSNTKFEISIDELVNNFFPTIDEIKKSDPFFGMGIGAPVVSVENVLQLPEFQLLVMDYNKLLAS